MPVASKTTSRLSYLKQLEEDLINVKEVEVQNPRTYMDCKNVLIKVDMTNNTLIKAISFDLSVIAQVKANAGYHK
jgi:hypothetical protein